MERGEAAWPHSCRSRCPVPVVTLQFPRGVFTSSPERAAITLRDSCALINDGVLRATIRDNKVPTRSGCELWAADVAPLSFTPLREKMIHMCNAWTELPSFSIFPPSHQISEWTVGCSIGLFQNIFLINRHRPARPAGR